MGIGLSRCTQGNLVTNSPECTAPSKRLNEKNNTTSAGLQKWKYPPSEVKKLLGKENFSSKPQYRWGQSSGVFLLCCRYRKGL